MKSPQSEIAGLEAARVCRERLLEDVLQDDRQAECQKQRRQRPSADNAIEQKALATVPPANSRTEPERIRLPFAGCSGRSSAVACLPKASQSALP
jgi:hypothetical protein